MSMKTNDAGVELIKSFEGCRLESYRDAVNVLTVGFGHTGSDVKVGQKITQAQAGELLRKDLGRFEVGVDKLVTVPLNENQFSTLVSFSYNLGLGNLQNSSLLKYVNKKDFDNAAKEFIKWNKAGGQVLNGLTRRREAEQKLFNTPVKSTTVKTAAKTIQSNNSTIYTVVTGDTVSKISTKYKVSIDKIKQLNKLDDKYTIKVNQKLRLK